MTSRKAPRGLPFWTARWKTMGRRYVISLAIMGLPRASLSSTSAPGGNGNQSRNDSDTKEERHARQDGGERGPGQRVGRVSVATVPVRPDLPGVVIVAEPHDGVSHAIGPRERSQEEGRKEPDRHPPQVAEGEEGAEDPVLHHVEALVPE